MVRRSSKSRKLKLGASDGRNRRFPPSVLSRLESVAEKGDFCELQRGLRRSDRRFLS